MFKVLLLTPESAVSVQGLMVAAYLTGFRQGDVTLERWDRMRSTGDRLKEALGFLYY